MDDGTCLQENPERKAAWLVAAEIGFPHGSRVRVTHSDEPAQVGATGKVTGYDLGGCGDWPLVEVAFDTPVNGDSRDSFYIDGDGAEIELVPVCAACGEPTNPGEAVIS